MLIRIDSCLELCTVKNPETGDWSGDTHGTSGMLHGMTQGWSGSLSTFNRKLSDINFPELTPTPGAPWEEDEDTPGRWHLSIICDRDGIPDEDGDYLYDISIDLTVCNPAPLTLDLL